MGHLHSHDLHCSSLLAIRDVSCRALRSGWSFPEAVHALQIILPRRGVFELRVQGKEYVGDPQAAFLLTRGEVCQFRHPADTGDDCLVVSPDEALLADLHEFHALAALDAPDRPQTSHIPVPATAQLSCASLRWNLWSGSPDALEVEEKTIGLICDILRHSAHRHRPDRRVRRAAATHRRRAITQRARVLLASAPGAAWSLHEVARYSGCSPFHLARVFNEETGGPLHRFLNGLRLAGALEQLAGSGNSITEIALDLGFASASHFCLNFRTAYGQTPTQFRRSLERYSSRRGISSAVAP